MDKYRIEVLATECISPSEMNEILSPCEPATLTTNCVIRYHIYLTYLLDHLLSPTARTVPVATLRCLIERGFRATPEHQPDDGSPAVEYMNLPSVTPTTIRNAITLGLAMTDNPEDRQHLTYLAFLLP